MRILVLSVSAGAGHVRAAQAIEQAERETDPQAQPAPDYEFDQRVAW